MQSSALRIHYPICSVGVTSAYSLKNPQMHGHTLGRVVLEIIKTGNNNFPAQWRNGEKRMDLWFRFFCKTLFCGQYHCVAENCHQTWKEMVSHSCITSRCILLLYLPHASTSSDPYVPVQKTDTSLSCGIYGYKTTCWHLLSRHWYSWWIFFDMSTAVA